MILNCSCNQKLVLQCGTCHQYCTSIYSTRGVLLQDKKFTFNLEERILKDLKSEVLKTLKYKSDLCVLPKNCSTIWQTPPVLHVHLSHQRCVVTG